MEEAISSRKFTVGFILLMIAMTAFVCAIGLIPMPKIDASESIPTTYEEFENYADNGEIENVYYYLDYSNDYVEQRDIIKLYYTFKASDKLGGVTLRNEPIDLSEGLDTKTQLENKYDAQELSAIEISQYAGVTWAGVIVVILLIAVRGITLMIESRNTLW